MRVLVCGGRDFLGYKRLHNELERIYFQDHNDDDPEFIVIQGGGRGTDFLAKVWVYQEFEEPEKHHLEFKADWNKYKNAAGPIRNQQMIDEGKPDLVVAFPGGTGTADMVSRAKKHNIKVIEVK